MSERVCAVIVTYNRKALLRECLKAVLSQTRPRTTSWWWTTLPPTAPPRCSKKSSPRWRSSASPKTRAGPGGSTRE